MKDEIPFLKMGSQAGNVKQREEIELLGPPFVTGTNPKARRVGCTIQIQLTRMLHHLFKLLETPVQT